MSKTQIIYPVGTRVKRVANDYTAGRVGTVIEVNEARRRVAWDSPKLRTWVNIKGLSTL